LGVDLTPRKTCTFDCVFCQLGRTTHKTVQRQAYVPTAAVIAELTQWLHAGGTADYITLAGSGEPTLHADFGAIIQFLRAATTIPVALLTNGSLLGDPAVRAAAAQANVVKASLSAWDQPSFASINRPHAALTCAAVVEGLRQFRTAFSGTLWLEVFIVWGMNSIPMDVQAIARLAQTVHPDLVQLNTAVRPPAEEFVQALPRARLEELAVLFDPPAGVIAEFSTTSTAAMHANENTMLALLTRRPCTADHLAAVFGMHRNEVAKYLGKLLRTRRIRAEHTAKQLYYLATIPPAEPAHAIPPHH